MEFGFITYDHLQREDFVSKSVNQPILNGTRVPNPKLYIGLTRWAAEHFPGSLYPSNTTSKNYLNEYSKQFNAIELNATHYHIPTPEQVKTWHDKVEMDDFHFCPKFSKLISHQGGLKLETKAKLTDSFNKIINGFNSKLGPSFIQLADSVPYQYSGEIIQFLNYLPKQMQTFIETRHFSWFNTINDKNDFARKLHSINKGWVITDTPGRRDAVHQMLTIPHAFIRFVANGINEIDLFRVQQWKEQLSNWYNSGLESCHFFIHVHKQQEEVEFARYVQSELNSILIV